MGFHGLRIPGVPPLDGCEINRKPPGDEFQDPALKEICLSDACQVSPEGLRAKVAA